jgi:hypothetical protein
VKKRRLQSAPYKVKNVVDSYHIICDEYKAEEMVDTVLVTQLPRQTLSQRRSQLKNVMHLQLPMIDSANGYWLPLDSTSAGVVVSSFAPIDSGTEGIAKAN